MITGRSVVLRDKRLSDATNDYAWRTDEELARLDATRPLQMSYDEFLRHSREELIYENASSKRLSIDTLDGRYIGSCMYYDVDSKRCQAELGIMIGDREYWGKGYGTDSVETLLLHIFTTTSLDRIYLHTLDWNHRARHCFSKSGFSEVKLVRRSGMDFVRMEASRSKWEKRVQQEKSAAASERDLGKDGGSASDEEVTPPA